MTRYIIGLDPGPKESAYASWDSLEKKLLICGRLTNDETLILIESMKYKPVPVTLAIEQIRGYGMAVGNEVFDTVEWIGRFYQQAKVNEVEVILIPRMEIKRIVCDGARTAKDKDVREALIYKYGDVGTKKSPGPLYGCAGDVWAALACAVSVEEFLLK